MGIHTHVCAFQSSVRCICVSLPVLRQSRWHTQCIAYCRTSIHCTTSHTRAMRDMWVADTCACKVPAKESHPVTRRRRAGRGVLRARRGARARGSVEVPSAARKGAVPIATPEKARAQWVTRRQSGWYWRRRRRRWRGWWWRRRRRCRRRSWRRRKHEAARGHCTNGGHCHPCDE